MAPASVSISSVKVHISLRLKAHYRAIRDTDHKPLKPEAMGVTVNTMPQGVVVHTSLTLALSQEDGEFKANLDCIVNRVTAGAAKGREEEKEKEKGEVSRREDKYPESNSVKVTRKNILF